MTSKIRHDVKSFAMTPKSLSSHQVYVITSKKRHDTKNDQTRTVSCSSHIGPL